MSRDASILHAVMIKPTHYDAEGYPIQWLRSVMPSNTLATINGLLRDCIDRKVLGDDVDIRAQTLDETNTRIRPDRIIRANLAQDVFKFFVTDDDLARNRNWGELFDRLIHMREVERLDIRLTIQVDMLCHRIDGFIEKACRAGVERVFMGLENINPDNLLAANKRQNKITEYRAMMQEWRKYGAKMAAGYIIGLPNDTYDSVMRDIRIIQEELPVDLLEFAILTPLPGSADHKHLVDTGAWMDPDPNKFDVNQRVTHHPVMSDAEWDRTYHDAWYAYYTPEHHETIGRRSLAQKRRGIHINEAAEFATLYMTEGIHPLEGGIYRRRHRRDRRPGLPLENPLIFYPRHWARSITRLARLVHAIRRADRLQRRLARDPGRYDYVDKATAPPRAEDSDDLALLTETTGAAGARHREEVIAQARAKALSAAE